MTELWLNFTDEKGEAKRILVEGEEFTIGRTPDNDLQLPFSNLSRQHAAIKRFADIFVISDSGSSNGSTLNGEKLESPVALQDKDILNLGEAVEIKAELIADNLDSGKEFKDENGDSKNVRENEPQDISEKSAVPEAATNVSATAEKSSFPVAFFVIAPILGLLVLSIIGGIILLSDDKKGYVVRNENKYISNRTEDDPEISSRENNDETETPTPVPARSPAANNNTLPPSPEPSRETNVTPAANGDSEKIEAFSASFLRKIAQNDQKAFLTSKQISILKDKINQFKASGGLAENLRKAKKNAAELESKARSVNLKPQFLASAALAKLGGQSGDVIATAQSMMSVLENLRIPLGSELADDNLLIIAAFDQGAAGKNLEMRDMVAKATKEFPNVSSRTIRTIWFLKDNKKITDAQFEFALRFLAIGTISQSPKDFNVQAEPLVFP